MDKAKQKYRIVEYCMSHHGITQHEASTLSIARLASRINDMEKDGYVFDHVWETALNQFGEKTRFVRYILRATPKDRTEKEEEQLNAIFMRSVRGRV